MEFVLNLEHCLRDERHENSVCFGCAEVKWTKLGQEGPKRFTRACTPVQLNCFSQALLACSANVALICLSCDL